MSDLGKIKTQLKSGDESLVFNGKEMGAQLLDFWKWSMSDLVSNATRGAFAEFVVATALNIDLSTVRDEWGAYDLISSEGIKVEVKTSAYIQTWFQKDYSEPNFSIRAARFWNSETNKYDEKPSRPSDVYVFCLLKHKEQSTLNPLNLEQWEFFVVPTSEINNYKRSESSITLNSLRKLTDGVSYDKLRDTITCQYEQHKASMIEAEL